MHYKSLKYLVIIVFLSFLSRSAHAASYYIDYSSGNDSNAGTSKTTPWQHAPGMSGCSANCASGAPHAGDSIILKGGVTWSNAAFPWKWQWSGSNGSPIYIGVDQTWYAGGAWTRPVFNANGTAIAGNNNFIYFSTALTYVTIDNIEFTGMYWSGQPSWGNAVMIDILTSTNITIQNSFFHNWSHDYPSGCNNACDDLIVILGNANAPYNVGTLVTNNVFDGSPNGADSGKATYNIPNIKGNVIRNMSNGAMFTINSTVSGNTITNINASYDPGVHENFLECSPCGGTNYIYNNVVHDGIGEAAFIGGGANEVDYMWNNVWFNLLGNAPEVDTTPTPGTSVYMWNNTITPQGNGVSCFHQARPGTLGTITVENNQCIGVGAMTDVSGASSLVQDHNVVTSPAVALSEGFSVATLLAPVVNNAAAVIAGAGVNLSSRCSGALLPLCTALSSSSAPALGPQRPTGSAAWDVGAFSAANLPAAPTGLIATVQ